MTLDVNALAKGQTFMAVGAYTVSDDGNLLAYSTDSTGFRQYTLRVKDLRTGRLLPDRMEKVVSVTWAGDGRTLFYTVEDHAKRSHRVLRHVLGTDPARDPVVYEERDERFGVYVGRTRSREYLVMSSGSHTTSEVRVLAAARPAGDWQVVLPRKQDVEYDLEHHGEGDHQGEHEGSGGCHQRRSFPVSAALMTGRSPWVSARTNCSTSATRLSAAPSGRAAMLAVARLPVAAAWVRLPSTTSALLVMVVASTPTVALAEALMLVSLTVCRP